MGMAGTEILDPQSPSYLAEKRITLIGMMMTYNIATATQG